LTNNNKRFVYLSGDHLPVQSAAMHRDLYGVDSNSTKYGDNVLDKDDLWEPPESGTYTRASLETMAQLLVKL